MIETLRGIGGFVLLVVAGLVLLFIAYFIIKNLKKLALILIIFGLMMAIAVGTGLFLGGLLDSLFGADFGFFSVLTSGILSAIALLTGGRWIWETFVQEKEWWPKE